MALTRVSGNSKGDTKPAACQPRTPGACESPSLPAAKLPSVRCKMAAGGGPAGGPSARPATAARPHDRRDQQQRTNEGSS